MIWTGTAGTYLFEIPRVRNMNDVEPIDGYVRAGLTLQVKGVWLTPPGTAAISLALFRRMLSVTDQAPLIAVIAQGLGESLQQRPLLAIATLFGAGVLTSLTPCIYPMIPISAAVISGTAGERSSRGRTIGLTLTYALGLALLYAAMGLLAGLTGSLFGTVAASPWTRFAIGNLLVVFALAMWDVIPVRVPARLVHWAGRQGAGSYPAVFLLGASSGIVAAPCGAPAFATVLTWVGTTQSALLGFIYLFVFSIGMTALLIVVGISSGALTRLPKSGKWLLWMKRIAGIIMLAMAEYYFIQMGMVL